MAFGQSNLFTGGRGARAFAAGDAEAIVAGVTLDWTTVPANTAGATLVDSSVIPIGTKFIPFGCILAKITATGLYGPHDEGANDGRQTLANGSCGVLDQTIQSDMLHADNPPGIYNGGTIYAERLKQLEGGVYIASDATDIGELLAVMPRLKPITV
jgi:hypothetical protein